MNTGIVPRRLAGCHPHRRALAATAGRHDCGSGATSDNRCAADRTGRGHRCRGISKRTAVGISDGRDRQPGTAHRDAAARRVSSGQTRSNSTRRSPAACRRSGTMNKGMKHGARFWPVYVGWPGHPDFLWSRASIPSPSDTIMLGGGHASSTATNLDLPSAVVDCTRTSIDALTMGLAATCRLGDASVKSSGQKAPYTDYWAAIPYCKGAEMQVSQTITNLQTQTDLSVLINQFRRLINVNPR